MGVLVQIFVYDERIPVSNLYYPFGGGRSGFNRITHVPSASDTIYLDVDDDTLRALTRSSGPNLLKGHTLLRDHSIGHVELTEGTTLTFRYRHDVDVRYPDDPQTYKYHFFPLFSIGDNLGGTEIAPRQAMMVVPAAGQDPEPPPFDHASASVRSTQINTTLQTKTVHGDMPAGYLGVECFATGTGIATPDGIVAVEQISAGDLVLTRDHGAQPVLWTAGRHLCARMLDLQPNLRPVRIRAGALGTAADGTPIPARDLCLSPQHRVLVRSAIARRIAGRDEALVAAKHLLGLPGISAESPAQGVGYHHILTGRHELLLSDGAWTESLFTGPQALRNLTAAARRELASIFPEMLSGPLPDGARPFLTGRQGRELARRSLKNRRALVSA
ncbi:MAG: Hint domain-containing protein [Paracoccus sp. (in: a-proteobacteria)]|nr:Hint domain-containing protein [Paracoccus sp. (in: a-proteobacteria)]